MPRAYCPECASEVPVDADGLCHVGHQVDIGTATSGGDADLPGGTDDGDEPQPWVASVDPTTSGGYTPPPPTAAPDEDAWTPDDGSPTDPDPSGASDDDDLAAAAAAVVESLETGPDASGPDPVEASGEQVEAGWPGTLPAEGEAPGWTPPTNDPVAPPPVPAPAPADPPAAAGGDEAGEGGFDLDDLAAAVSDLNMDDEVEPSAAPTEEPSTEQVAAPVGEGAVDLDDDWDDELSEPPAQPPVPASSPEPSEPVDLSNFTAKSGKVRTGQGGGKKGGLFRRR